MSAGERGTARLRVGVVSQYWYDRGGTEVLARHLAAAFEAMGHDVALLYLDVANRASVDRPGMPGTVLPAGAWSQAMQALETWKADEVVLLLDLRNGLTEPVSRASGSYRRTIYVNINNAEAHTLRGDPGLAAQLRATILRFDRVAVFFEGSPAAQVLQEWRVPYRVAGTGIPPVGTIAPANFRQRHGIAPADTLLLCVGLVAPLKYQVEMLAMMPKRAGQRIVFIGDIYSGTPDYGIAFGDALLARTDCLWLDGVPRADVLSAMAASDLLLFPSQSEGAPLVLLESMAVGLPWITTPAIDFARELEGGVIIPLAGFQPAVDALMQAGAHRAGLSHAGREAQATRWNLAVTAATFAGWFTSRADRDTAESGASGPHALAVVDVPSGDVVDGDTLLESAALESEKRGAVWMAIADAPLSPDVHARFVALASDEHDAIVLLRQPAPADATAAAIAAWLGAGVVAFFVRTAWWRAQPLRRTGSQPRAVWSAALVAHLAGTARCYLGSAEP